MVKKIHVHLNDRFEEIFERVAKEIGYTDAECVRMLIEREYDRLIRCGRLLSEAKKIKEGLD